MGKLFKRGRIWFARVPKRGGGTKRVSTLCTDKRAAEAALAQLEREAVDPAYAAANKATTQRILDEYYLSRERLNRAEGTLHHVRIKAGALVGLLPARAVDLTHPVLERYIDARTSEGAQPTTIKKELRVLKAALGHARKNGLFARDPGEVIPEYGDDYKPRTRALSPWELVGLANELEPDRAAHVVAIVGLGARWSESLKATGGDLEQRPHVPLRGTKTAAAARRVPRVFDSLITWASARAAGTGTAPAFAPWLNVRRDLAAACKRLGIEPVTPNDLRRTFATWLRSAGVEPSLIGTAMGHTTSRMVEKVYGRLAPDALGKLLNAYPLGGTLMGHTSDDAAASGASGAKLLGIGYSQKQAVSSHKASAQGRNRTADTGIFNPRSETVENSAFTETNSEVAPACVTQWVTNGSRLVVALRHAHAAVYGGRVPA